MTEDDAFLRRRMIEQQIVGRGVRSPTVLNAMAKVERHLFIPGASLQDAYADTPLSIGWKQTISQPYIVAVMTELLDLKKEDRVLEVGTGSGYQTAVLAELTAMVYSLEIVTELELSARNLLTRLGYENIEIHRADGSFGWAEAAPYDAIILAAAPENLPEALYDQLKKGGRMVLPLGVEHQDLVVIRETAEGRKWEKQFPVRFVPMTGAIQR